MILDDIIMHRKVQLEREKSETPFTEIRSLAENNKRYSGRFFKALSSTKPAFICEVKKASPSKGVIAENFQPVKTALAYESAGAAAISCLTEEHYFMGSIDYLEEIAASVKIPVLRKDFIFDEYQIYEAAARGAAAVLLIAAVLEKEKLCEYINIAESLGLDCLVESHNEEELKNSLAAGAKIIGINNRNLKTFEVSLDTTVNLSKIIPEDKIIVSESGIKTHEDIVKLKNCSAKAFLIGETLMRSGNIKETLDNLRRG